MRRSIAISLSAIALPLLLAACAGGTLRIDDSHPAAVQASRVQHLVLHYTVADFEESLDILTGHERGVSAHYLVRDALSRNGVQDRQTYLARVRTLIQMRNRL